MLAKTRVDKPAGAGLWACDDTDATVSGSGERWISDSGATENMTPDPTGFERYETAPPGRTVEMGDGTLLPVAGYGDLRLKIEQDDADGGQTRDLVLRRAAHVPGLRHNLLSAAQLSATFEHPMQLWPRAAVFRCPRNGQSVIFRKSARRLFEATPRRSAIMDQASAKALVVAKPTTCDIMMFHQLVGHPGEDITRRTAQVAGTSMAAQQRMLEQMAAAPPLAQQAATAAAAAPPETRPSTMRIDFEKFSGEPEDWNAWSKVYMAQISALGCEDVLTTPAVQDVKVGADNFDGRQVNPETLRKAKQVWVSLITNCKGVAFEIVQGADSPSQAWRQLVEHYRASGVKEWRRLALDFYSMKMELGEHPRQFFLRVDRLVKEMERVGRPTLEKDIDIVLLTGLSSQYDAEVRMLESSAEWPDRAWIERAVYNQYDRLTREKSEAGPKALASVSRVVCPPEICQFCSQAGHTAANCRKLEYAKREPKGNGKRGSGRRRGGKTDKDGTASADRGDKKLHRLKCYYCEGPHIQANCPEKSKDAPRPTTGEKKGGGMLAKTRVDKPAGAGLWACDDTDATVSGSGERWISDSGATENMTPDPTGFERYETAPPGRTVEMGDGTLLPVAGYGDLRLKIEQDDADGGQTRDLVLRRAAHVPGLRHNLLSAAQLSATFEHPMQLWPRAAVFRCPRNGQSVIFRKSARRLFEATPRRSAIMDQASAKALVVAKPTTCDIMMFHQLVGHPGEDITRRTAQVAGLRLTGKWNACEKCSEARVLRHAVPKSTETRADKRAGRVFIDLAGPFHVESLAGSRFAMLCVDDFSRYKIVAFMAKKSDATAVLRAIIAKYFAPAGLNIGVIRTDNGGEFQGAFQSLLAELGIKHERTPPYTPQYNGVAERTLGLLRDKTVALLRGVTEGASERLWAEAMAYACDMSNKCVTDSLDHDKTPYEMWHGRLPAFDTLLPFGTVGYRRVEKPAHKLASRGAKCILLGTAGPHDVNDHRPRGTFRVRDLTTGAIIWRQAVAWHPVAGAGGDIPLAAATGEEAVCQLRLTTELV